MRLPCGIHVGTDHVSLGINSSGARRRRPGVIDRSEAVRRDYAGFGCDSESGVELTRSQQEPVALLRHVRVISYHRARWIHVPRTGRDAEGIIERSKVAAALKVGMSRVGHHVGVEASGHAAVGQDAVIHRSLRCEIAEVSAIKHPAVHGPHRVRVMIAADNYALIRNLDWNRIHVPGIVHVLESAVLEQPTPTTAARQARGIYVNANNIALVIDSSRASRQRTRVIDRGEGPPAQQKAVLFAGAIHIEPHHRVRGVDALSPGRSGSWDIEGNIRSLWLCQRCTDQQCG